MSQPVYGVKKFNSVKKGSNRYKVNPVHLLIHHNLSSAPTCVSYYVSTYVCNSIIFPICFVQFFGFNELLGQLNIDATHIIKRNVKQLGDDIHQSYFFETLQRCREKDGSLHFSNFCNDVNHYIQSLPLLLHHKDKVCDLLLAHLQVEGSICFKSLYE